MVYLSFITDRKLSVIDIDMNVFVFICDISNSIGFNLKKIYMEFQCDNFGRHQYEGVNVYNFINLYTTCFNSKMTTNKDIDEFLKI